MANKKKKTKANKKKKTKQKTLEIVRSFSWKLSLPGYENRDFFASAKSSDVKEKKAEAISEKLYLFCKSEVIKSVNSYLAEMNKELQLADLKKNKVLWEELKKYFAGQKDEVSDCGKQNKQEKYNEESKLAEVAAELKESEK